MEELANNKNSHLGVSSLVARPISILGSLITYFTACPEGKVFKTCGTACPETCDSGKVTFCTKQCVIGCFCESGTVELRDECVDPSECP